jgi:hypothetical protein
MDSTAGDAEPFSAQVNLVVALGGSFRVYDNFSKHFNWFGWLRSLGLHPIPVAAPRSPSAEFGPSCRIIFRGREIAFQMN